MADQQEKYRETFVRILELFGDKTVDLHVEPQSVWEEKAAVYETSELYEIIYEGREKTLLIEREEEEINISLEALKREDVRELEDRYEFSFSRLLKMAYSRAWEIDALKPVIIKAIEELIT